MAGLKRKLSQVGQDALERLELPVNIAADVARIELLGNRELYMDRHRGVLAYSTEEVDVNGGGVVVRIRGEGLQLLVMTEQELRLTGKIGPTKSPVVRSNWKSSPGTAPEYHYNSVHQIPRNSLPVTDDASLS